MEERENNFNLPTASSSFDLRLYQEPQNFKHWQSVPKWRVVRDLYYGRGGVDATCDYSYLVNDSTELFYQTRKASTPFAPWFQVFIDAQYKQLYGKHAPVFEVTKRAEPWIDNVDRCGTNLNEYLQEVTLNSLLDGVDYIGMAYDGNRDKMPYVKLYLAQNYNVELSKKDEKTGEPTTYVFSHLNEVETKGVSGGKKEYVWKHLEYVIDEEVLNIYKQKSDKEGKGRDKIGELEESIANSYPPQPIYSQRKDVGKVTIETPLCMSVAGLCVSYYNSRSSTTWLLRRQGNAIMVIRSDDPQGAFANGLTSAVHINTVTSDGGVEFAAPPADLGKNQMEEDDRALLELFEVMRHGGVIAQKSSQIPESGASKAFTFQPVEEVSSKAKKIAEKVIKYYEGALTYYLNTPIEIEATMRTDFTPKSGLDVHEIIASYQTFMEAKDYEGAKSALKQLQMLVDSGDTDAIDAIEELNFEIGVNKRDINYLDLREAWAIAKETQSKEMQDEVVAMYAEYLGLDKDSDRLAEIMREVESKRWKSLEQQSMNGSLDDAE